MVAGMAVCIVYSYSTYGQRCGAGPFLTGFWYLNITGASSYIKYWKAFNHFNFLNNIPTSFLQ